MNKLRNGITFVVTAALFAACAENAGDSKYVDIDGDGNADIEYKADNTVVDLNEDDGITVEGTTVTNADTNEEWDLVDEQALENSFDNVKTDLKEFGNDVKEGAENVMNNVEEGAKNAGDAVKEGAKNAGEAVKDGANKVGEGVEKAGQEVQEATDGDGNH